MTETVTQPEMATDEQVDALVAATGMDEGDAGSYTRRDAAAKLRDLARPAPSDCRCGCGQQSRGQFFPGHDAKHKSALANRLFGAWIAQDADASQAVIAEADSIDAGYDRTAGYWAGLITKQAENMRLAAARAAQRDAQKTPVQRARKRLAAAVRAGDADASEDTEEATTVAQVRKEYIDDLMSRLGAVPLVGQCGWAKVGDDRIGVRVWTTKRDQGESDILVKVIETGAMLAIPGGLFHRDVDLERIAS